MAAVTTRNPTVPPITSGTTINQALPPGSLAETLGATKPIPPDGRVWLNVNSYGQTAPPQQSDQYHSNGSGEFGGLAGVPTSLPTTIGGEPSGGLAGTPTSQPPGFGGGPSSGFERRDGSYYSTVTGNEIVPDKKNSAGNYIGNSGYAPNTRVVISGFPYRTDANGTITGPDNVQWAGSQPGPGPQSPQPPGTLAEAMQGGGHDLEGVSPVNPQAGQMDYDSLNPFIDAAYNQSMQRLSPQFEQQSDRFDQQMVNRGIGVDSEAYGEAKQRLDFNQNDARSSAAFNAMGFGTGVQNQMFGQDATRSSLANTLLRAQMGNDLGYAGLNEGSRQFDSNLGEGARRYDDSSDRAWDAQGYGQMMGLEGNQFRNQAYNDSRSDYGNAMLMALLGYGQPNAGTQWNADPNSPYNAQLGYGASTHAAQTGLTGDLLGGFGYMGGGG